MSQLLGRPCDQGFGIRPWIVGCFGICGLVVSLLNTVPKVACKVQISTSVGDLAFSELKRAVICISPSPKLQRGAIITELMTELHSVHSTPVLSNTTMYS